jgi:hypothetical protein
MALIEIDQSLNKSEEISDFMLFLLNEDRVAVPRLPIPQILLAKARPGLSSDILSASIIARFPEIGIPTGPLVGGAANVMEAYTKALVEEIIDAIQNDMRVDVVTDAGATVSAIGANAGGPVTTVGATVAPHTAIGVAR